LNNADTDTTAFPRRHTTKRQQEQHPLNIGSPSQADGGELRSGLDGLCWAWQRLTGGCWRSWRWWCHTHTRWMGCKKACA